MHTVELVGYVQLVLAPVHDPRHGALPAQAARVPRGCPEVTVEHVPTEPVKSHAWHWPVHDELQHTPSTQAPLAHSPPPPQGSELGLPATQLPPTQYGAEGPQCASPLHVVRQSVPASSHA